MKFVTFTHDGTERVGIIDPEQQRIWPVANSIPEFSGDMLELVRRWKEIDCRLSTQGDGISVSEVTIGAPIPIPERNILCVGKNYLEHSKEFLSRQASGFDQSAGSAPGDVPEAPIIFTKSPTSVIAPGEPIHWDPGVTQQVDYEAELGVIIGTGGRGISFADAYAHVKWGYMIINDAHGARAAAKESQTVVPRKIPRQLLPHGALDCHGRRD